jgi:hypothetical protein
MPLCQQSLGPWDAFGYPDSPFMTDHADVHEQLRLLTARGAAAEKNVLDVATAELETERANRRIPRTRIMARFERMLYGDD